MDELTPTPDVEAGELIYLSPDDLDNRVFCAIDGVALLLEDFLHGAEVDLCDTHFMELVSEVVVTAMHSIGIVSFELPAEVVAHVRTALTDRLTELEKL